MVKPKVFVNSINKNIKNNKDVYHYKGSEDVLMIDESVGSLEDVRSKIDDIFDSDSFVYKSNVVITLKDGSKIKEEIIAFKDSYLLTLSNKRININDIIDIKKAL